MKLLAAFTILFLSLGLNAEKDITQLADNFLKGLVEESVLDFKIYFLHHDYYEDGSIKNTNTVGFVYSPNKSCDFDLESLGTKKIGELVKKAEDDLIVLSVVEDNPVKNTTNCFDTKKQEKLESPSIEILENVEGYAIGVLEQVLDTLYETKTTAQLHAYEYYDNDKIKRHNTMTLHAQEVMVKDKHKMSAKMVEESQKLLKKALKVDVADKAVFIVEQFDKRYPAYKWSVLINPKVYTCKNDVMVSLKYNNNIYTILGKKI